jgi:hypothetical protein
MREFDEHGNELYGILMKNLYGSPAAPLNWSKCFNKYLLTEMGKEEGWDVKRMHKEPCLYRVTIDGYVTWMVVHVDDIDGAAQREEDSAKILRKLAEKFGISIVQPKYMLGVQREMTVSASGVRILTMTQVAYIEDAWEEWKQHRKGYRAPSRPADGLKFTDENGRLIIPEDEEHQRVTAMGYRRLIGTVLWPARNAYPVITYAVVQLCRAMEKPSERAWQSAMHCLHYLHEHRHEGVTFRSDADPTPICYYDSGHMQDRVDYRSFYGYVIVFMGGPIHWVSKKHQHVGESSTEDEYMALAHAGKMVVWMRQLFIEMGLGELVTQPTIMLGDNKQAGRWSRTDMQTNGNRFIERQYYKVNEFIENGHLETRYINTKLNPSDMFTKDVSKEVVDKLAPMMTGLSPWPDTPSAEDSLKEQVAHLMRETGLKVWS